MSVKVVARIRPLLKSEIERDCIVDAAPNDTAKGSAIVRIPNPKNAAETFSFQFNSVYGQEATQQDLFDNEVSPTIKHLFNGFDVTLFAYGVTGTGKTHTMRGGKTLAERGVIPRLLSAIYRKGRKIEKDSDGENRVEVAMSYYEIYNDRVFDLFEAPDKRTPAGLPIRDNNGKTVVAGLTERPCTTLKEFELLYDQANVNRSTSATKLNAHSSRSHAILCVKISQITAEHTIISTASAIDLAGSEDNRRTENGKERLVESSSINKSLFVLAQCVEAISKKQSRIPYRESKMTRILSLGQNNGLTVMILNLAPVRSYHLDTLSSLNFANRTKKIEIREVENEPIFKFTSKQTGLLSGNAVQRQPLRPIPAAAINVGISANNAVSKPTKAFSVYAERDRLPRSSETRIEGALKRTSGSSHSFTSRPSKAMRPSEHSRIIRAKVPDISRANLEELVNRMVEEKLASKALNEPVKDNVPAISEEVQRRLASLEQRVEKKEDARAEGLQYLLMAKQHQARNEDASAMKMYQLALPFFPENEKLAQKMLALQSKLEIKRQSKSPSRSFSAPMATQSPVRPISQRRANTNKFDDDYRDELDVGDYDDDFEPEGVVRAKKKAQKSQAPRLGVYRDTSSSGELSPRTSQLLRVINTRDLSQIRSLKGVGAKKAEAIVNSLCSFDEDNDGGLITDLEQLGGLRGVGLKSVETMRSGISV